MDEFEQENDEVAAEAEQAEYHLRMRTVHCDVMDCSTTARATQKELSYSGWLLGGGWELCPHHDD